MDDESKSDPTNAPDDRFERYVAGVAHFGLGVPYSLADAPDLPLRQAAHSLRAAACGEAVVHNVTFALRTLLSALPRGDLRTATPDALADLKAAIDVAGWRCLEDCPRDVSRAAVMHGLGSAFAIVAVLQGQHSAGPSGPPSNVFSEHLDYVALLADELDASERRRRIADGGNLVARFVAVRAAQAAEPAGEALH